MLSALHSSISGIRAQDTAMSSVSGNIANASSTGYKGVYTAFKTMVNNSYYYGSGVLTKPKTSVEVAGFIEDTGIVTDLAVQGEGMFIVSNSPDNKSEPLYTKEGSFRKDKHGNLVNIGGAYLTGWSLLTNKDGGKVDVSKINSETPLEVVNLKSVLNDVIPTENIKFGINLDANENIAKGSKYNLSVNFGLSVDDVIYDRDFHIGDGFSILSNGKEHDFIYGGLSASDSINLSNILGARNINENFSELKSGDNFSITTEKLGTVKFTYSHLNPDTRIGEFNSMETLMDAINFKQGLRASIVDGVLCVAPTHTSDSLKFTNGFNTKDIGKTASDIDVAYGVKQFYDMKRSIDMGKESIFGIKGGKGASNNIFTNNIKEGDGIIIATDTGNKYKFVFTKTLPAEDKIKNEFNSLKTLADAITKHTGGELKATIDNDVMTIKPSEGVALSSITNMNVDTCTGSNIASNLKIDLETQFSGKVTHGDYLRISYGSYSDVKSAKDRKGVFMDTHSKLGKNWSSVDLKQESVFGINSSSASLKSEIFNSDYGAVDGDGIKITTSKGTMTLKYKDPIKDLRYSKLNSSKESIEAINEYKDQILSNIDSKKVSQNGGSTDKDIMDSLHKDIEFIILGIRDTTRRKVIDDINNAVEELGSKDNPDSKSKAKSDIEKAVNTAMKEIDVIQKIQKKFIDALKQLKDKNNIEGIVNKFDAEIEGVKDAQNEVIDEIKGYVDKVNAKHNLQVASKDTNDIVSTINKAKEAIKAEVQKIGNNQKVDNKVEVDKANESIRTKKENFLKDNEIYVEVVTGNIQKQQQDIIKRIGNIHSDGTQLREETKNAIGSIKDSIHDINNIKKNVTEKIDELKLIKGDEAVIKSSIDEITSKAIDAIKEIEAKQQEAINEVLNAAQSSAIHDAKTKGEFFYSLETLADLINKNTGTLGVSAKVNGSTLLISTPASNKGDKDEVTIISIDDYNNPQNTHPSNFASKLQLKTTVPKYGDKFKITLSNGSDLEFTYVKEKTIDKGTPPDHEDPTVPARPINPNLSLDMGEFDNIETLTKAIAHVSNNDLVCEVKNNQLSIRPSQNSLNTIHSITNIGNSTLTNYLGISTNSRVLDLKYVDKYSNGRGPNEFSLPNTSRGEFNNMATLRRAIQELSLGVLDVDFDKDQKRMSISVLDDGKIHYIRDHNVNGKSDFATNLSLNSYDIVSALGFEDVEEAKTGLRFSKLSDIKNIVNDNISQHLISTVDSVTPGSINIEAKSVLDTVEFKGFYSKPNSAEKSRDYSSFLNRLGLDAADNHPKYVPSDPLRNMASGNIQPQFSSNLRVVDSLGVYHNLSISFLKTGINKWAFEIYAANHDEINSLRPKDPRYIMDKDGLIAYGNLEFNGEGDIKNIDFTDLGGGKSDGLSSNKTLNIAWNNGANPSIIKLKFDKDEVNRNSAINDESKKIAIRQISADYEVDVIDQDGVGVGNLKRIDIDESGIITANFDNGAIKQIYKIPLATFYNPEGLTVLTGNLYAASGTSGLRKIHNAGNGHVGTIRSSALESSNVETTKELTRMILIKQGHSFNATVLKNVRDLLEETARMLA